MPWHERDRGELVAGRRRSRMGLVVGVIAGWTTTNAVAIVAILAGLAGTSFSQWWQGRMKENERREQRQREAVLALGGVYGLLVDAHPSRLANVRAGDGLFHPGIDERLAELLERWKSAVRPGLLAIEVGYPDPRERELARLVAAYVHNTLVIDGWYVQAVQELDGSYAQAVDEPPQSTDGDPPRSELHRNAAIEAHARASAQLDELGGRHPGGCRVRQGRPTNVIAACRVQPACRAHAGIWGGTTKERP